MDIDRLLTPSSENKVISFANADGKRWIMPVRAMKLALAIYQPGSVKGRMMKRFLPVLWRLGIFRHMLHSDLGFYDLIPSISQPCADAFHAEVVDWSLFGGTPSADSKVTIQCVDDGRIAGYCKVTDSHDIAVRLFKHESLLLDFLNSFEEMKDRIPFALDYSVTGDDLYLFIQSTVKTLESKEEHQWTPLHQSFQSDLHRLTATPMKAAETDTFLSIRRLYDTYAKVIPEELRDFVSESAQQVLANFSDMDVSAVVTHRDFTPWNMIVNDGSLFVFDWEYGIYHGMPGIDKCHFLIQTALFEQHISPEVLIKQLTRYDDIDAMLLKIYLLDIISLYAARSGGKWSDSDYDTLAFRARLLGLADSLESSTL